MNTDAVLPVLFELLTKSALISLAAALLTRAWRSATAAQRHLVWLVALVTIIMLPATRLVAPFWKIPLVPAKQIIVVRATLPNAHLDPIEMDSSVLKTMAPAPMRSMLDWRKALLCIWLSGAALLLSYRVFGSWRLHRLMRRSALVDDPRIRLLLRRTLGELDLHRRPEIRFSEECRVPLTWGSLRPVMLLPKAALQWDDTWLAAALRHEAAHIRRYDYLTRWFAHVACAVYWPNPLVWLLARSLRVAQELAADDLVLRAGTPPEEYASQLVDAARAVATHGFFVRQAVAMACPSTLEDRVRAIVDGRRDRRPLSRLAVACGSLTIAAALALSTAAQLRSDEQKPVPAPSAGPASPVKFGRQIEIESKFIEISTAPGKVPPPPLEKPAIYSDSQFQVIIRSLNQEKGVDMLAAPRVKTADNQRAVVEVIREIRYPTAWEKEGRKWKSTAFETRKCGVTLDVTPRITADGAIELQTAATIVEFRGFVDLDNDGQIPAKKKVTTIASEFPPVPAGHRTKPVFSEQKTEKTVTLESGQTAGVLIREATSTQHVVDGKTARNDTYRRQTLVFVSARILAPAPAKAAPKDGAAAAADGDPAAPAESVARKKALEIVLPLFELRDATITEAIDALTKQSVAFDPEKTGIKILLVSGKGPKNVTGPNPEDARITVHLINIPLIEALKYVTELANLKAVYTPAAVELRRAKPGTTGANPLSPAPADAAGLVTKEWKIPPEMIPGKPGADGPARVAAKDWLTSKGVTFDGAAAATFVPATSRLLVRNTPEQVARVDEIISVGAGVAQGDLSVVANDGAKPAAEADGPALAKAEKIVIPDFELREATLVEALKSLRKQSVEFDPDKTGVKIVLKPGTVSEAKVTVSLKAIPVVEALKYVTSLANLEFVATPDALVVQPIGDRKTTGRAK